MDMLDVNTIEYSVEHFRTFFKTLYFENSLPHKLHLKKQKDQKSQDTMDGAMMPSVMLDVQDMKLAQDQYADFVDIHRPILSIAEFKEQCNLALNEKCASVFYAKTAHLKDNDFIEIDRSILETIGFKNTFTEQKDKKGNLKLDENGQPKLKDTRSDFSHAIRCLKNTAGFIEGSSLNDTSAHFVIEKHCHLLGRPSSQTQHHRFQDNIC